MLRQSRCVALLVPSSLRALFFNQLTGECQLLQGKGGTEESTGLNDQVIMVLEFRDQ